MISKIFLPNLMWEMLKIVFFLLTRVQLQSFPVSWLHGIPCMTACLCHYWSTLSLFSSLHPWKVSSESLPMDYLPCLFCRTGHWEAPTRGGWVRKEREVLPPYSVLGQLWHRSCPPCAQGGKFYVTMFPSVFWDSLLLGPLGSGWLHCCWKFLPCPLRFGMNPSVKKPSWTVLECCMCFLLEPYLIRMIWFVIAIDCVLWQVCCRPKV